jgi:hypothetical protein
MNFCGLMPAHGLRSRDDADHPDGSRLDQFMSKTEVEDKLDWLEAHGIWRLRVSYDEKKGFVIEAPTN